MDVEPQPDTIKLHNQHSLHSHPQTYHDRAGVDQQRGQVLTSVAVWKTRGSEKCYEYAFIYITELATHLMFLEKDTDRDNLTMAMSLSRLLESQPGCCIDLSHQKIIRNFRMKDDNLKYFLCATV